MHTLPAQYRMKAHCPGLKGAPGTWIHLHMFSKCHPLLKWTTQKTRFRPNSCIGIYVRYCQVERNTVKRWSIYWGMHPSIGNTWAPVKISCIVDYCTDYWVQEEDSKWEQMIYLWRGLTLKQYFENIKEIQENERIGHPLTHFPSKIKTFPLSFSARKINQNYRIIKEFHAYRSMNWNQTKLKNSY